MPLYSDVMSEAVTTRFNAQKWHASAVVSSVYGTANVLMLSGCCRHNIELSNQQGFLIHERAAPPYATT